MPKAEPEELKKVTVNLYANDYARLGDLFPVAGAAKAIRTIVRQYLQELDKRVPQATALEEIDL